MKIKELVLETSVIKLLLDFYHLHLGFPILKENESQFTLQIGTTQLTFRERKGKTNPFYHFAINIPENRMIEALNWLEKKTEITINQEQKIINFPSWNAHAIYFNDPAGNIVEVIGRHQLASPVRHELFTINEFLRIDEIGIPVIDVLDTVGKFKNELGLSEWRQSSESFATIGDEEGLFIIVKEKRQWYMSEKEAAIFPIQITIQGEKKSHLSFSSYTITSVI